MLRKSKGTVLVVDDSAVVLDVIRGWIEHLGYRVVTLDTPLGVARTVFREHPDVVLMDIEMPALSGDRAVEVLNRSLSDSVSIVLHSSLPDVEVSARAATCGAAGFIGKTSDQAEFSTKFETVMMRLRAKKTKS